MTPGEITRKEWLKLQPFKVSKMKWKQGYFTKGEVLLWCISVSAVILSSCVFSRENYITPAASVIGVTSLIFNAKGNPFGQLLMILFAVLYGMISYTFSYYGEMITYLGMTAPMAGIALISWLKNPYEGNRSEVKVNRINKREHMVMWALTALVTVAFYFILKECNTAYIIPSTISVTTSFLAAYLTFRRSPYYAAGYAANDIVLILLWILAAFENKAYLSVVVCFVFFFINDMYGFFSWKNMERRQAWKGEAL